MGIARSSSGFTPAVRSRTAAPPLRSRTDLGPTGSRSAQAALGGDLSLVGSRPGDRLGLEQVRPSAIQRCADQIEFVEPDRDRLLAPQMGNLAQRRLESDLNRTCAHSGTGPVLPLGDLPSLQVKTLFCRDQSSVGRIVITPPAGYRRPIPLPPCPLIQAASAPKATRRCRTRPHRMLRRIPTSSQPRPHRNGHRAADSHVHRAVRRRGRVGVPAATGFAVTVIVHIVDAETGQPRYCHPRNPPSGRARSSPPSTPRTATPRAVDPDTGTRHRPPRAKTSYLGGIAVCRALDAGL